MQKTEKMNSHICILPYIIENGILSKIGVLKNEAGDYTLIDGKKLSTDIADIKAAKRILNTVTDINITDGIKYMYLGNMYNANSKHNENFIVYCVDVSDYINEYEKSKRNFYFINTGESVKTDDMLILSSYLRLFNLFYAQNIGKQSD